ncbi:MAG: glutamate--tRNA ligase [Bacteroidetes bacterium]|nr:glutamate--tRNA ligase [Bacteroidota bacterium]
MERKVRVRFAPSPTGPLHIGGVRTALYNYLFAKKHNGDFILRIEDTDQGRFVPGAEEYIIESLNWCGVKYNEGVGIGGPHAPYRQSERKALYKQYADFLVDKGFAYYAFDSAEELDTIRKDLEKQKITFQYGANNRNELKNSLTISAEEVQQKLNSGEHYVIRIKIPENEEIQVNDLIRGLVTFSSAQLDDKVLYKSDGMPTYHLANVVDDYLMQISHVIRGEEWLPSAPLHVLLYRYLGWENEMPQFAHLPLLLKPDGNGKLSKRDGDRLGFPVFPLRWEDPKTKEISSGYRESGYFADGFINMLALLGWNPGTEQEIFSLDQLVDAFTLDRVGKSGSKFDPEKAKWFNHQYLQTQPDAEIAKSYLNLLTEKGVSTNIEFADKIVKLIKNRANFIEDLWAHSFFFFSAPTVYDEKVLKDKWKENTPSLMLAVKEELEKNQKFEAAEIKEEISAYLEKNQIGMGQVMNALRLLMVGASAGPDLFEILALLGKEEVIRRIDTGLSSIKK